MKQPVCLACRSLFSRLVLPSCHHASSHHLLTLLALSNCHYQLFCWGQTTRMQASFSLHRRAVASIQCPHIAHAFSRVARPVRASAQEPAAGDANAEQPAQSEIVVRPMRRLGAGSRVRSSTSKSSGNRGPEASTSASTAAPNRKPRRAPAQPPASKGPSKAEDQQQQDDDEIFYADADKFERAILDERSPYYQPMVGGAAFLA